MRSHLEFVAPTLLKSSEEPEGFTVAHLLAQGLPACGFEVIDISAEDWGYRAEVAHDAFPLWIGCGRYLEYPDGVLCFIDPSKPYVRRWLKRISTMDTVERLASAIQRVIEESGQADKLRWWSEEEAGR